MLGMVFTEFLEMVEKRFSPETADAVIDAVPAPHGGAYTAVGNYPHQEIVAMVVALSQRTGVPVDTLLQSFGQHLIGRFAVGHSELFSRHANLFDFLASIDGQIHVHVRRLYENAKPPRFIVVERTEDVLKMLYQSNRSMESLAVGLLEGAAEHFGERVHVEHAPHRGSPGDGTLFTIRRH